MPMPVKLSDQLVLEARQVVEVTDRSLAGQIEYWARIGKAMEMVAGYAEVVALKKAGNAVSLSKSITEVGTAAGRARLNAVLEAKPFPQYAPTEKPGVYVRIDKAGRKTKGRFVKRQFVPLKTSNAGRVS